MKTEVKQIFDKVDTSLSKLIGGVKPLAKKHGKKAIVITSILAITKYLLDED